MNRSKLLITPVAKRTIRTVVNNRHSTSFKKLVKTDLCNCQVYASSMVYIISPKPKGNIQL